MSRHCAALFSQAAPGGQTALRNPLDLLISDSIIMESGFSCISM
jgi:hypothetical protein